MSRKSRENKLKDAVNNLVGKSGAPDMSTVAETVVDTNPKLTKAKADADAENKSRTGKGTRVRVGQTRGKNPQVISWEAFDDGLPESLPGSLKEFVELTKVSKDEDLLELLITGYNAAQYSAASDPIAEFVNPVWPADVQAQFRISVRSFAKATGQEIEEVAATLRPAIDKKHAK